MVTHIDQDARMRFDAAATQGAGLPSLNEDVVGTLQGLGGRMSRASEPSQRPEMHFGRIFPEETREETREETPKPVELAEPEKSAPSGTFDSMCDLVMKRWVWVLALLVAVVAMVACGVMYGRS